MSVVEAVNRELARMPEDLGCSTLAASALALAEEIDGRNSATSKSMCAKELRETMGLLRSLAPPKVETDRLDEVSKRRRRRRATA